MASLFQVSLTYKVMGKHTSSHPKCLCIQLCIGVNTHFIANSALSYSYNLSPAWFKSKETLTKNFQRTNDGFDTSHLWSLRASFSKIHAGCGTTCLWFLPFLFLKNSYMTISEKITLWMLLTLSVPHKGCFKELRSNEKSKLSDF